jgi:hypothetical protein
MDNKISREARVQTPLRVGKSNCRQRGEMIVALQAREELLDAMRIRYANGSKKAKGIY